jgi:hypothetical protein
MEIAIQLLGQSSIKVAPWLDSKDLLSAALAYFSASKVVSLHAVIMQAISAASRFGGSPDRAQSGAVVVNTILNMIVQLASALDPA